MRTLGMLYLIAVMIGMVGLLGMRHGRSGCLLLSAMAVPALILLALWVDAGLENVACILCVVTVPVLCGLPEIPTENPI